jgi:hypothetical protein
MNTKQIEENVKAAFKALKDDTLIATEDGQVFRMANKSFAKSHCERKGIKSIEVKRNEVEGIENAFAVSASNTIEEIEGMVAEELPTEPADEAVKTTEAKKEAQDETGNDFTKKVLTDFLADKENKSFTEMKDLLKSLDARIPTPKSKAEALDVIEKALAGLN